MSPISRGHEKHVSIWLSQSCPVSIGKLPTPIIQPCGEMTALLDASYQKARLAEIVLDKAIEEYLACFFKEQRNFAKIQAHGLTPRRKILLVGQPGTGKTLTASVLAGELGISLFVVRLDR
jgi:Holliday junction resolvasome RuvABC ATP-dependent DNA helicase subunit